MVGTHKPHKPYHLEFTWVKMLYQSNEKKTSVEVGVGEQATAMKELRVLLGKDSESGQNVGLEVLRDGRTAVVGTWKIGVL